MKLTSIKREDLIIQSKCGLRFDKQIFDWRKANIIESVDGILKRLQMEYIDVLLLHRPDLLYEPEQIAEAFDELEKGTFGLLEPNESKCEEVRDFSEGLCIVPGFAFDFNAYRLGYGYGYYDRFLQHFGGTTVGICYSNCITPKLPHGRYDKPVDIIVTNSYIKEINYR